MVTVIMREFEKLQIHYPKVSEKQKHELQKATTILLAAAAKNKASYGAEKT